MNTLPGFLTSWFHLLHPDWILVTRWDSAINTLCLKKWRIKATDGFPFSELSAPVVHSYFMQDHTAPSSALQTTRDNVDNKLKSCIYLLNDVVFSGHQTLPPPVPTCFVLSFLHPAHPPSQPRFVLRVVASWEQSESQLLLHQTGRNLHLMCTEVKYFAKSMAAENVILSLVRRAKIKPW